MIRLARYYAANCLFHAGLRVLPAGRVRSELSQMFDLWRSKVERTVRENQKELTK